jgi:hypothetical protein
MKESTLDRIISIVRHYIVEEGMSVSVAPTNSTNPPSQINIAGLPPDNPPVSKKNKNNIFLGKGSRKNWMQKRKPPQ